MRIFIAPSDPGLINIGDISMLQVAVARLKKFWPEAVIQVLTIDPDRLPGICPGTESIDVRGQHIWFLAHTFLGRFNFLSPLLLEHWLVYIGNIFQQRSSTLKDLNKFLDAVFSADLIFVTGMGMITDSFPVSTERLLAVLKLGYSKGALIVMMGQGIGPLKNPKLRSQAQKALPLAQIIALREERGGLPLLRSLGVEKERILVTGDDAIEVAYPFRKTSLGNGIGVNLRAAPSVYSTYSGITNSLMEDIRCIIQDIAQVYHAPLIPVPVSRASGNDDAKTIQFLLSGYADSDGGAQIHTAAELVEQIKQCRVVITGSYHAGVFALSLGIPVIALAKSDYYVDKFLGLAQQFGTGCDVILLNSLDWAQDLKVAFDQAWSTAEDVKPVLLESALKQIESGHAAYQQIYKLFC